MTFDDDQIFSRCRHCGAYGEPIAPSGLCAALCDPLYPTCEPEPDFAGLLAEAVDEGDPTEADVAAGLTAECIKCGEVRWVESIDPGGVCEYCNEPEWDGLDDASAGLTRHEE